MLHDVLALPFQLTNEDEAFCFPTFCLALWLLERLCIYRLCSGRSI